MPLSYVSAGALLLSLSTAILPVVPTGAPSESQLAMCVRGLSNAHAFDPIISSLGISPKEIHRMWTKLYIPTCALVCYS